MANTPRLPAVEINIQRTRVVTEDATIMVPDYVGSTRETLEKIAIEMASAKDSPFTDWSVTDSELQSCIAHKGSFPVK